ncbi:MAG: hypothetical protein ABIO70_16805 [Pseudomonadota bacterium]
MRRPLLVLLPVAALTIAGSAWATLTTPDAKYRALKPDGTGNCVFSDGSLPYQQEDGYSVKAAFTAPEIIKEARCYFPQQLQEYQSLGAFFNSLRDEYGRYNVHWVVADDKGVSQWETVGVLRMNGDNATWDQQRFIMDPSDSRCSTKSDAGCLDPDAVIRAIAAKQGAALPYTGKVCGFVFLNWSDDFEKRWDGAREVKDPVSIQTTNIASGCVEYTVK